MLFCDSQHIRQRIEPENISPITLERFFGSGFFQFLTIFYNLISPRKPYSLIIFLHFKVHACLSQVLFPKINRRSISNDPCSTFTTTRSHQFWLASQCQIKQRSQPSFYQSSITSVPSSVLYKIHGEKAF